MSRKWSFQSWKGSGNWPVRQPPGPTSQGSLMSLTVLRTGSVAIAVSSGWRGENSAAWRPRVVARSKRKPSTPTSVTQ